MNTTTIAVIIIVVGVIWYICWQIKNFFRTNLHIGKLSSLFSQIEQVTDDTMHTPRTLSGSESIMVMRLKKDFPEFDTEIARQTVSSALTNYFAILNERSGTARIEKCCTDAFIKELEGTVMTDSTVYNNPRTHKIVISDYRRTGEDAVITFQAAVEYQRNKKALAQYVYEIKYVYYLAENSDGENVSLQCEYCGAPISTVGAKVCEFCGSEIFASVERTWKINKIYKAR